MGVPGWVCGVAVNPSMGATRTPSMAPSPPQTHPGPPQTERRGPWQRPDQRRCRSVVMRYRMLGISRRSSVDRSHQGSARTGFDLPWPPASCRGRLGVGLRDTRRHGWRPSSLHGWIHGVSRKTHPEPPQHAGHPPRAVSPDPTAAGQRPATRRPSIADNNRTTKNPAGAGFFAQSATTSDQSPCCFCMCSQRSWASMVRSAVRRASRRSRPISSPVSTQ